MSLSSPGKQRIESYWEQKGYEIWAAFDKPEPPIDPDKLCAALELKLLRSRNAIESHFRRRDNAVYIDGSRGVATGNFASGHEVVHALFPHITHERAVNFITMVMLMPRSHAEALIRSTWCLWEFANRFGPHLNYEVSGRRLVSLDPEVQISLWKEGEFIASLRHPAIRITKPSPIETELAMELFEERSYDRINDSERLYAIADDRSDGRFVITVGEYEKLKTSE